MGTDELEYEIFVHGTIVKKVKIQQIKPCIISENMIKVLMQRDSEIKDIIPLLIGRYPPGKVNFIKNKGILTLNIENRLVTLYPSGKISMNNAIDKEDAIKVVTGIMKIINEIFIEINIENGQDYSNIHEKLLKIGPLQLYNCLPKTNCEKCGEITCIAFAIKLLSGDIKLDKCESLIDRKYIKNVSCLKKLLGIQIMQSMGWTNIEI
ncbi:MAG: (Fe-S)-binding protein [Methanobacterium sp.]|nr:(Fe-S)-binding protein [Methanobacterium sp.]